MDNDLLDRNIEENMKKISFNRFTMGVALTNMFLIGSTFINLGDNVSVSTKFIEAIALGLNAVLIKTDIHKNRELKFEIDELEFEKEKSR